MREVDCVPSAAAIGLVLTKLLAVVDGNRVYPLGDRGAQRDALRRVVGRAFIGQLQSRVNFDLR